MAGLVAASPATCFSKSTGASWPGLGWKLTAPDALRFKTVSNGSPGRPLNVPERPHNPKVGDSNPSPATKTQKAPCEGPFASCSRWRRQLR